MSRQVAMWTLAALLGIVLTAGMTWATNRLTSQHIGISSEPISAGARLAPPTAERSAKRRSSRAGHPSKTRSHLATPQSSAGSAQSAPTGQASGDDNTDRGGASESSQAGSRHSRDD